MQTPPRCLLLPVDGTEESLRPISFIRRLYPVTEVSLILCYFTPPPPPIYTGLAVENAGMLKKKREFAESRQKEARRIFTHAKEVLLKAGFSEELIQEHIQQREMSVARHACLLADIRKVDAIVVQKRVTSSLEGFILGDPTSALLQHCLSSPVWFTDGEIDPKRAAICIVDEDAALRMADHAGYMLSNSGTEITLLLAVRKLPHEISCRPSEVVDRLSVLPDSPVSPGKCAYLRKAAAILKDYEIDEGRIRVTLIPDRGDIAGQILTWCASNRVGIVGLGHSEPEGIWGALKTSVTRKILSDFRNMAVWVVQ